MPSETRVDPRPPRHIAFLLLPGFSLLGFTNAVETLREANELLGHRAYRWSAISSDGRAVRASSGLDVPAQAGVERAGPVDAAFVCAELGMDSGTTPLICRWLQRLDRNGTSLGALNAGTYVLARAEVLRGRRCTIHWEAAPALCERFPETAPSRQVFEVDRGLYTCAGDMSALDLFVRLVGAEHGKSTSDALGMRLQLDRVRSSEDEQRSVPLAELALRPLKLQGAIREMEATLDAPVSPEDIAARVGVTTRHLQRLFRAHTGASPARFYMDLRLRQARLLLHQTRMPVLDVAVAVGFTSHSHFSKRYRERYERTPQRERSQRQERAAAHHADPIAVYA